MRKKQHEARAKLDADTTKEAKDKEFLPKDVLQNPNPGNGGETEKYIWSQTMDEASLLISLPYEIKAHHMDIKLGYSDMYIKYKDKPNDPPLVEGKWREKVNIDETYWSIEKDSGKATLHVTVEKKTGTRWWKSLLEGDIEVDTFKCKVGKVSLSELAPNVRGEMERKLYDDHMSKQGYMTSRPRP